MRLLRFLVVVLLLSAAGTAHAGITLVSGPGTAVANPVNQKYPADPYNIDTVFYWTERTSFTLTSNLVVSILPPASFPTDSTSQSTDTSLTVPAGRAVNSYLLNYDPQSGSTVADFRFDEPIIGLITYSGTSATDDHFVLSDYLINPLVPTANLPGGHYDDRGIEPASGDFIRWFSASEIEIHLGASSPGDQIRVITAAIPEPATAGILAAGMMLMLRTRRRRIMPARS